MAELIVDARNISKTFGRGETALTAVAPTSFSIAAGDRIALTGPSGSGKSTLLHLIGGLDHPSSGEIRWPALGSIADLRPVRVVDIFQGPSLLEPLTVLENVCLPLLLHGSGERQAVERSLEMLAAFGIDHLRDRVPAEISGGQAQRAAIARALTGSPSLILADEPTGQLDTHTAISVLETMMQLVAACGSALVVATHDPRVARFQDIEWRMHDGVLDLPPPPRAPVCAPSPSGSLAAR